MTTPFRELHHICIVVRDIEASVAFYESIGIGPWQDYPPLTEYTRLTVPNPEAFYALKYKLGEGGLGAVIPGNIGIGDVVELEIQLPLSGEGLTFQAEVRYRQGFQYGFRFLHPTEQQRELIRRATRDLPAAP